MAGQIDICPGADPNNPTDRTAKRIAWIGRDPDNSSTTGAYFKQNLWVGGTNASNAPFQVNGSGNVSLSGTLAVSNTVTIGPTTIYGPSSSEYASYLTTLYTPRPCADAYSVKIDSTTRALGQTEDVDIVAPGGASYRLHFKGGIYTGRTSLV